MSEEKRAIKVTDKRMFTPEGELREEYRFLGEKSTEPEEGGGSAAAVTTTAAGAVEPQPAAAPSAFAPDATEEPWDEDEPGPALEMPGTPPELGGATFFDLIAMLAEPIALYLGDVLLPNGQSAENPEMARIHIDLLDVVRRKSRGNVTAQESTVLEDILYRSRMRYVQRYG